MASGYKVVVDRADLMVHLLDQGDWRADIFNYLKDSARHQLSNPMVEEVNERSTGIGKRRSVNRL
jgi:hypothetical protein